MSRKRTTPLRQRLGRALRELREGAGLTIEAAAAKLYWSSSKLGRIEQGHQTVDIHGVRSMLDLYDAGERWTELTVLALRAHQPGWWRAYGLDDTGYVPLEAEADQEREYALGYVPGLLQTEDYARALFQASLIRRTQENLANELQVRMIRQRRLTGAEHPLEFVAVLDESVLYRPIGGPAVLFSQLNRLIKAAAMEHVTLQLLPTQLGARPASAAGFTVLGFSSLVLPDTVYLEHPVGSVQMEKEDDVARANMVFNRLRSIALSPVDSVALVRQVIERTY